MPRRPTVPPELTHGPFTLEEARRAGITRWQLEGAVWRRLGGALAADSMPQPSFVTLLTLSAVHRRLPTGPAFSGRPAAWLPGVDPPPCDPIEVIIPPGSRVRARAGVSVHLTA